MDKHEMRQLDRQIAEMLGWRIEECGVNFYKKKLYHVWTPGGKQVGYWEGINEPRYTHNIVELELESYHEATPVAIFPHYTTDLNAALSLVIGKPDIYWAIEGGESGCYWVRIYKANAADAKEYDTSSTALAFCKAWLSLMAQLKQIESDTP